MLHQKITPPQFTPEMGAYSHGVVVPLGNVDLILVTGQIAVDSEGKLVSADIEEQTLFVFENIKKILSEGDATFNNVIKAQIFLTDINDFSKVSPIRNRYFEESHPVSTLVEVNSLVVPGCKIEIEVMAAKANRA